MQIKQFVFNINKRKKISPSDEEVLSKQSKTAVPKLWPWSTSGPRTHFQWATQLFRIEYIYHTVFVIDRHFTLCIKK